MSKWFCPLVFLCLLFFQKADSRPAAFPSANLFFQKIENSTDTGLLFFEFTKPVMGTEFRILLYAADSLFARQAAQRAFERIEELDEVFSDYREDSELSKLNSRAGEGQWIHVSQDFFYLTRQALEISKKSGGAFDISMGGLTRLWRKAFRQGRFPDLEEIQFLKKSAGYRNVELDKRSRSIRFRKSGARLDFGGIAKGYAADEALSELRKAGINIALVDGGGDIAAGEAPPGREGWLVEYPILENSGQGKSVAIIKNKGLATSGDAYRYLEWEGKRYSHILDPHGGMGLTNRCIASVFAPNCTLADAWATAGCIGIGKRLNRKLKRKGIRIETFGEQARLFSRFR